MHRARTCASSSAIRCRAFAFADAGIGARSTVLGAVRSGHFARRRVRADSEFVVILSQHWRAAETSCRRRCRARRPTPADSRYWGRSKSPFYLGRVCSPRPRRASSAPQSTSGRPPRWESQLGPRAAAAGGLGGPRPRAPAIGGDPRRLSARARCATCARAAPPALLEANDPPRRCSSKHHGIAPWCIRARERERPGCISARERERPHEGAGNDGRGTRNQDHPGREICDAATGVQNNEDGDAAREPPGVDKSKERSAT